MTAAFHPKMIDIIKSQSSKTFDPEMMKQEEYLDVLRYLAYVPTL